MQDDNTQIGRFDVVSDDVDRALLGRARFHVLTSLAGFQCPDCDGDPDCATCGEPTRPGVLDHLQRALRRRLAS